MEDMGINLFDIRKMKVFTLLLLTFHIVKSSSIKQEIAPGVLLPVSQILSDYFESSQFVELSNNEKEEVISEVTNITDKTRYAIHKKRSSHHNATQAVPASDQKKSFGEMLDLKIGYTRPSKLSFGIGVDGQELVAGDVSYPLNCLEIMRNGHLEYGIYTIKPTSSAKPFQVLCDMQTQGGGWTQIQKRVDGRTNFYRGWTDYKFGFGYLDEGHEFWLGNEKIHQLTAEGTTELLIQITDRDGEKAYALYKSFAVGKEQESYPLSILSDYSGDAGDSLEWHRGMKFSTPDFDNDLYSENCAEMFKSGWWYNSCFTANLNGKFTNVKLPESYMHMGIHWSGFKSLEYCHAKASMYVRPKIF